MIYSERLLTAENLLPDRQPRLPQEARRTDVQIESMALRTQTLNDIQAGSIREEGVFRDAFGVLSHPDLKVTDDT